MPFGAEGSKVEANSVNAMSMEDKPSRWLTRIENQEKMAMT